MSDQRSQTKHGRHYAYIKNIDVTSCKHPVKRLQAGKTLDVRG